MTDLHCSLAADDGRGRDEGRGGGSLSLDITGIEKGKILGSSHLLRSSRNPRTPLSIPALPLSTNVRRNIKRHEPRDAATTRRFLSFIVIFYSLIQAPSVDPMYVLVEM